MIHTDPLRFSSPECISTILELNSLCCKDDIIIYGTGKVGKLLIPYLQRHTHLKILGVTASDVDEKNDETFLDTKLPVHSPQTWYEEYPNATVLIAVVRQDFQSEIQYICREIGFQRIFAVSPSIESELIADRTNTLISPENKAFFELLLPRIGAYLVDQMCIANEIQDTHRASFAEFKGCHKNQSVAVVGSGPSLNYYTQINNVPHIGVNTVFLKPGIKLDYYFTQDYRGEDVNESRFRELKNYQFVKFFGTAEWRNESRRIYQIPENLITENHARKFAVQVYKEYIHCDIEHYPLMGLGSIIFSAFHFALHTSPKRIFLIGCDCSPVGHYDGSDGITSFAGNLFVDSWKWVKEFVRRFYPGIEIISVNPIGLKGVFQDVYTKSYLDAHPEIDRSTCVMLDSTDYEAV